MSASGELAQTTAATSDTKRQRTKSTSPSYHAPIIEEKLHSITSFCTRKVFFSCILFMIAGPLLIMINKSIITELESKYPVMPVVTLFGILCAILFATAVHLGIVHRKELFNKPPETRLAFLILGMVICLIVVVISMTSKLATNEKLNQLKDQNDKLEQLVITYELSVKQLQSELAGNWSVLTKLNTTLRSNIAQQKTEIDELHRQNEQKRIQIHRLNEEDARKWDQITDFKENKIPELESKIVDKENERQKMEQMKQICE
eukprot:224426_1